MIETNFKVSKTGTIVVRVLKEDKKFLFDYVANNTDMKMSEFVREAIQEKINKMENGNG